MQALMSAIQHILSQIITNKHHTLVNNLKTAYVPAQRNELRPNNQNLSLPRLQPVLMVLSYFIFIFFYSSAAKVSG